MHQTERSFKRTHPFITSKRTLRISLRLNFLLDTKGSKMNSNLIGKVVEQLGGGRGGGGNSGTGGLAHKVQDAVTGQKHLGDSQGSQGSGQYGNYRSLPVVHASLADISLLPGNYPNAPAYGSNQPAGQSQYGQYPPQGGQQQGYNRQNHSQGGHGGESEYANQGGHGGYNSGQGNYSGPGYGGHGNARNDGHGNQGYEGQGNQGYGAYGDPGNDGHGNQGYGGHGNQGHGGRGNQGYGGRGNQGHGGSY